ncbi:peptide transporter ptr2 [Didymella heteroderae]|uniref:Peptide transporter ptr2 n=1 Tax=Didymella heteroderae TaxID=1769908 RepID=A0A9P4WGQ3_9PLEO|nr:peptide transporter ptr2 [Didymella heteroderae]
MVVACIMLIAGKRYYVKVPHEKNALPEALKIVACACRNGFAMARADPAYQLEHRHMTVSWSRELLDELTRGLQACRILLAFVTFYVCFDQMQNNLISQAGQMETNSTPNDLLPAMNQVGCIVLGPLIQEVLYPFLHRRRVYPTPVSRIAIGFAFVTLSMLYATVVQLFIYRSPPCYDRPGSCGSNEINVWIQAPLYFLISAGEIFAYVTALEYAYDRSPKAMKVVVQAVGLLVGGVGSACAMALTPVARDPYLVVFYGSLAAGMAATTIVFWMLFRERDGLRETTEVVAGPAEAIRGPVHHDGGHAANNISDIAPLLQPIDAGGPIQFPSSIALVQFHRVGLHKGVR